MKPPLFLLLLSSLITLLLAPINQVQAINMSSDAYQLQWTNLNMTSGAKSSTNYNILDTVGQLAPGEYSSTGYYVKAGFPYIKTIIAFAFTISDLSIDFGSLTPNTPSTQTNTLTVSSGGAGGYSVTALENNPLKLQGSATTIPDTVCDGSDCDETTASVWSNNTTYGFGYNMSGDDIPAAFIDSTYYKQFADHSSGEAAQIVVSSNNVGANRIATVTYKANINSTQAAGDYENSITFTATPGY